MNETRPGALSGAPMTASGPGRLLVVDDDSEFLSPVCEFLSEVGYQVRGCASATEALKALKEQSFDLLITDLVMPDTDGIMLMREAFEIDPHLTGIIITGQATIQTAVDAMKVGAFDYLVKPLEFRTLVPLVSRALGVHRLRIENAQLRETVEVYKLKQALQESENLYKTIFESSGTAIIICEEDNTISFVNSEFEVLSGYSREETEGRKRWTEFVAGEDLERIEEYCRVARTDPAACPKHFEFRFVDRHGTMKYIYMNSGLIPGTKRGVASLMDITERRKAEVALKESERRFHEVMKNVKLITVMLDAEGRISFCNDFLLELTGWRRDEVMGRNWFDIFIPDDLKDELRGMFNKGLRADSFPMYYENEIRTRSGEKRLVLWNNTVLRDLEGECFGLASIGEDITERKKAEGDILNYQKALRSLSLALSLAEERERRRIAADLHDTIGQTLALTRIKLGALSALVSSGGYHETVEEIIGLIEQSIRYTRSLTAELSPPVLYELGFEAAVESLAEQMQKEHGLRVDLENDGQPMPFDESVRILLYKAVRELLINVIKHAKAHRADISIRRNKDFVEIILTDDGVGFNSSRMKPHGNSAELGFGLFNIRERIESIDGCFEIKSSLGHGTRVAITAPLKLKGQETSS